MNLGVEATKAAEGRRSCCLSKLSNLRPCSSSADLTSSALSLEPLLSTSVARVPLIIIRSTPSRLSMAARAILAALQAPPDASTTCTVRTSLEATASWLELGPVGLLQAARPSPAARKRRRGAIIGMTGVRDDRSQQPKIERLRANGVRGLRRHVGSPTVRTRPVAGSQIATRGAQPGPPDARPGSRLTPSCCASHAPAPIQS